MEIKDFFDFGDKSTSSTFQAGAIGLERDKDDICGQDNLIKGKYNEINFPIVFKQKYGTKLLDILGTGWPSLYLISDRMKTILEENQITGWKTFPIKLYDKKNNEILGYQGFSITGRCGESDHTKAEIMDRQRVPMGPIYKVYKGLYIGLDKWDRSDFFIPDESLRLIITKKAVSVLEKNKITNMRLENLSDVEVSVRVIEMKNQADLKKAQSAGT